eukprot:899748-Pyramimonas_sp.AAC.1
MPTNNLLQTVRLSKLGEASANTSQSPSRGTSWFNWAVWGSSWSVLGHLGPSRWQLGALVGHLGNSGALGRPNPPRTPEIEIALPAAPKHL